MTLEEMIAAQKAKQQQQQNNVNMTQQHEQVQQMQQTQQVNNNSVGSEDYSNKETYEDEQKSRIDTSKIDVSKFEGSASSKFVKPYVLEDVYNAEVESIELKTGLKDFMTGELKDKFLWTFKLVTDAAGNAITEDANGKSLDREVKLSIFTNIAWGMKSTNYKMYSKIMNSVPQKDEKYNILDCVGKKCRINVVTKNPENGLPYSAINGVMTAKN